MAIPAKRALGWSASATALCLAGCATPPQAPTTAVTPTDQPAATRSTQTVPLPMRVDAVFPVRDGDRTLVRAATFHPTTNVIGRNNTKDHLVASVDQGRDGWSGRLSFNLETDHLIGDRTVVNGMATVTQNNLTIRDMRYDAYFAPPHITSGLNNILKGQQVPEHVQLRDLHSTNPLTDAEVRAVNAGFATEKFLSGVLAQVQAQKAAFDSGPQTSNTVQVKGGICDYRNGGSWDANFITAYGPARVHVTPFTADVYTRDQSVSLVGKFNAPIAYDFNIPFAGNFTSSPVISATTRGGGVIVTENQRGQNIARDGVTSQKQSGTTGLNFKNQDEVTSWARSWQQIALFAANKANSEGCFNNGLGTLNQERTPTRTNGKPAPAQGTRPSAVAPR